MSFLSRAALVLSLLTSTPTLAEELHGRVVAIADGDTLTLLVEPTAGEGAAGRDRHAGSAPTLGVDQQSV